MCRMRAPPRAGPRLRIATHRSWSSANALKRVTKAGSVLLRHVIDHVIAFRQSRVKFRYIRSAPRPVFGARRKNGVGFVLTMTCFASLSSFSIRAPGETCCSLLLCRVHAVPTDSLR